MPLSPDFGQERNETTQEVFMSQVLSMGIYAGVPYIVAEKNGKKYIGLQGAGVALIVAGADKSLLQDIGDQDPDEVMERFVESLPKDK